MQTAFSVNAHVVLAAVVILQVATGATHVIASATAHDAAAVASTYIAAAARV